MNRETMYRTGTQEIIGLWGDALTEQQIVRTASLPPEDQAWQITLLENQQYQIAHRRPIDYYRALGMVYTIASQNVAWQIGATYSEVDVIAYRGVLLDCSRNAVYTVAAIEKLLQEMAILGLNELYLYMEDIYPIKGYPYFGYRRGRYTKEELQAVQAYAALFGIEVIPAIQTLAHLATTLRWSYADQMKDTADILLVDSEQTEAFIAAMLDSLADIFTTRNIHVGLDEADMLGTGNYLFQYGYTQRRKIMATHMALVERLCKERGFSPMVWSDMFIRPYSKDGGYYNVDADTVQVSEPVVAEDTTLVYWDYYHTDSAFYQRYLAMHQRLASQVAFAGGAWTWCGLAPNYSLALASTDAAYTACLAAGVQRAICTLWFDNGAETPLQTALLMLTYHAFKGRKNTLGIDHIRWFNTCFDAHWDDWLLLGQFDHLPNGVEHNASADNPSKWLLYQDPMLGLFDYHTRHFNPSSYYTDLATALARAAERSEVWRELFTYYQELASALALKAEIGVQLRAYYAQKDRSNLAVLAETTLTQIRARLHQVRTLREELWSQEAKRFGFEVIDVRFGALQGRLEATQRRINAYLNNEIDGIEELEESALPFKERAADSNRLYCASSNWIEIISANTV